MHLPSIRIPKKSTNGILSRIHEYATYDKQRPEQYRGVAGKMEATDGGCGKFRGAERSLGRREHPWKVQNRWFGDETSPYSRRAANEMDATECRSSRGTWIDGRTDGRTDRWTDGRAHRWRVARSEKGCRRRLMALHRWELQPHRRLCEPDGYRVAARVVVGGGATSIGGLLPVRSLGAHGTEGWIGAKSRARKYSAPRAARKRHAAQRAREIFTLLYLTIAASVFPARKINIANLAPKISYDRYGRLLHVICL